MEKIDVALPVWTGVESRIDANRSDDKKTINDYVSAYVENVLHKQAACLYGSILHFIKGNVTPDSYNSIQNVVTIAMDYYKGTVSDIYQHHIHHNHLLEARYICCNPRKNLIAVANTRQNRVVIFDTRRNEFIDCRLRNKHMMQGKGIRDIAWSESDTILVACDDGVSVWRIGIIEELTSSRTATSSAAPLLEYWSNHLYHPSKKPIDLIETPTHGRLFVTLTRSENCIYVWDSAMGGGLASVSPICLVDTSFLFTSPSCFNHTLAWSPTGVHLTVSNSSSIVLIETNNWKHQAIPIKSNDDDRSSSVRALTWLCQDVCLYAGIGTMSIYSIAMVGESVQPSTITPTGFCIPDDDLPVHFTGGNIRIGIHAMRCIGSDDDSSNMNHNLVAITFYNTTCDSKDILPFVLIYACQPFPYLNMTKVSTLTYNDTYSYYPKDYSFVSYSNSSSSSSVGRSALSILWVSNSEDASDDRIQIVHPIASHDSISTTTTN